MDLSPPGNLHGDTKDIIFVACFVRIALAWLREVVTKCKFRGKRGILQHVMKFGGSLARNIDFEVANFQLLVKTRSKTSIFELQLVKIEGSLP